VSRLRGAVTLAGLSIAFALAPVPATSAWGQGAIWAECISGSVAQTCQVSSWYTSPLVVVWHAAPSPEATSPCFLGIEYPFETDTVTSLACSARWRTEGSDRREVTLHVEVSAPTGEAIPERPPDSNGWYDHPVAVTFKGRGYSGPASCQTSSGSATGTYSGEDALSASVGAVCVDPAGKSVPLSFALHYDSTPPTITGAYPSRPPDFNGWYNHPVTFAFTGTDATSGMEPCRATYAGPDSAHARLVGSCRDRAGNAAAFAVPLRYGARPPELNVGASAGDGVVSLHWRSKADVEIKRSPGLHGPRASTLYSGSSGSFTDTRCRNGVNYTYAVKTRNRAGRVTVRSISITPGPRLLAPAPNAVLVTPPLLRWTSVKGATYYNVQLYRGHKVLSVWPVGPSLQLNRSWRYGGTEQHLAPGRYSWYVWPGFGAFGAARYGRLIGHRSFFILPSAVSR
jgi:hypothetical protein